MSGIAILGVASVVLVVLAVIFTILCTFNNSVFDLYFALAFGAGAAALFTALFFFIFVGMQVSCRNTAQSMDLPYRYSISTDCLARYQGHWVPLDQVRQFLQAGNP